MTPLGWFVCGAAVMLFVCGFGFTLFARYVRRRLRQLGHQVKDPEILPIDEDLRALEFQRDLDYLRDRVMAEPMRPQPPFAVNRATLEQLNRDESWGPPLSEEIIRMQRQRNIAQENAARFHERRLG